MPEFGVAVVVLDETQVLLTQREDFENWCLPGGGIEPGESVDQAAIREVREETGIEITLRSLVGVYSRPFWGNGGTHIIVFAATPNTSHIQMQANEVIDIGYFPHHQLPQPLFWEHRQYIRDALNHAVGEVWVNPTRIPTMATTRKALYQWRDSSGLPRAQAYEVMMAMVGRQSLHRVLGTGQYKIIHESIEDEIE